MACKFTELEYEKNGMLLTHHRAWKIAKIYSNNENFAKILKNV